MASDDRDLVRRAQHGDRAAAGELVERYAPMLTRVALALTGRAADAEDVVQEAFTAAMAGIASFRGESSVKTWLTRILVRQAALHHRLRRRFLRVVGIRRERPGASAGHTGGADARMDVAAAIADLPPQQRQVVVLREMQGLSYDEIAQVLAIPTGTVESRLFRARRALAARLKAYLED